MPIRLAAALTSLALAFPALASEHYQPVRVELALVGAYGPGDISIYGGGLAVEPKYNIADQLALGLRFEAVVMASESVSAGGISGSLSGRATVAILAKADYFFTTSSVRPFLGFGAGYYGMGSSSATTTSSLSTEAFSGFGVFPQIGVNFGHFRLAAGYNIITGGQETIVSVGTTPTLAKNYFSFEIGGTIGGGRTDDK